MSKPTGCYLTKAQVREEFGFSPTTLWRLVKRGCFPCYRLSHRDVRFRREEIIHFIEGCRIGRFAA